MQAVTNVIQYILDLGPAIFVGLIIFLLGLLVRAKPGKALSAGITLGVAFGGVGLVIGYLIGGIAPAGQAMTLSAPGGLSRPIISRSVGRRS